MRAAGQEIKPLDAGGRLSAGQFYGHVAARRKMAGLILSETYYPSDSAFPRHSHDLPYLCFLISGANVEQIARREVDYRPFAAVFHPIGEEHTGLVRGGSRLFVLELDQAWVARMPPGRETIPGTGLVLRGASLELAARLYHEFRLDDACSPLAVEGLACEMLAAVRTSDGEGPRPGWLARVEELLHEQADGCPDLVRLASEARVHPVHLARVFRRCHGMSMGAYRRRLKIESACAALARPGASLADIAAELGFVDQSHFTRTFKSLTGLTPGRFRRVVLGRSHAPAEVSGVQDARPQLG